MIEDTVRWSLKVSRETDEALRAHLGRAGGGEDFARALQEIRRSTRKLSKARFEKLVAEAVAYARARR